MFAMQDFDRLGVFYLGRKHDLSSGQTSDEPLLYDSQNLTTHAVCVGMTGSGKTGLCLSLLEEAALDGIPALVVDPKGDLGNLLLTFPELRAADFRPWIDPAVAAQKGVSPDEFAQQTADLWRNGLAKWGQDGERIRRFAERVDRTIYTPGSSAGVPLTILKSFAAPPQAVRQDGDALRDRIESAASGVLALVGVNADPAQSREHILLSNILNSAWQAGRDLDLVSLIQEIQQPSIKKIGVADVETFLPAAERLQLGMKLNNLLASPSFASWLEGEPLDVQKLLYTDAGQPRTSILSIGHMSDSERMFFVTILLNELLSWVRSQPGTGSLRAIFYMDEVFGFFPPLGNPPAKRPMLTLLKQARAFGVGCVLATQNPVDLDYKGLSNAGTWFLGRLQTERDKQRVLEGLEGASAQAGAQFDRGKMEATLAALGSRVFLMNNVHQSTPTVFHTRWALSYLAGPLTRQQISTLMAEKRQASLARLADDEKQSAAAQGPTKAQAVRHILSAEIVQRYWPMNIAAVRPEGATLVYRPALVGVGRLHFVDAADRLDAWQEVRAVQPIANECPRPMWSGAEVTVEALPEFASEPAPDAVFAELPSECSQAKNYKTWTGELEDRLYQRHRYVRWQCQPLDERSRSEESEADFKVRMDVLARERRDAEKQRIRDKFASRIKRQEEAVAKAKIKVEERKSRFWWKVIEQLLRIVEVVGSFFLGRRSRKQLFTTTSAGRTMSARRAGSQAEQALAREEEELQNLKHQVEDELELMDLNYAPSALKFEKTETAPRKADISVDQVMLAWLPWWERAGAASMRAF
jgi:hypothetical protein